MPVSMCTGALGFEPRGGGTKTRCLTTWLRPNNFTLFNIAASPGLLSSTLIVYFRKWIFTAGYRLVESLHSILLQKLTQKLNS